MSYPAYQGVEIPLSIHVGAAWRHEIRVEDRSSPAGIPPVDWAEGVTAEMVIADNAGTVLAALSTGPGLDGTITLGDPDLGHDVVICELPAAFTATLPPTDNPAGQQTKGFISAVIRMTDQARPLEPYPFAYATRGVITRF